MKPLSFLSAILWTFEFSKHLYYKHPTKLLTIQGFLSIIRPYNYISPSLDGRGKGRGRVDGYGVINLSKDSSGRITVSFHYDPDLVAKVKTIEGRKWNKDKRYWSFPIWQIHLSNSRL
jgi:hypothetical protein